MLIPDERFYELAAKRSTQTTAHSYAYYHDNPEFYKKPGRMNPFNRFVHVTEYQNFELFLLDIKEEEKNMKELRLKKRMLREAIKVIG